VHRGEQRKYVRYLISARELFLKKTKSLNVRDVYMNVLGLKA
jgi:hypothetical protein